jgi:integrase
VPAQYTILGGKVYVYRRDNSRFWQCSSFLAGRNRRVSTKEESLSRAKDFAEDWYLELRGKHRRGDLKNEKTFRVAADQFMREFEIITEGQRSPQYVDNHMRRLQVHLVPFFGEMGLSEITPGVVQEYRIHRLEKSMTERGKPPAHNTMHQEIVALRQTLKTALRHDWLTHLPDLSQPYRSNSKVSHRAWFSPEEYKRLYEATRSRARAPKRARYTWESEQLHDYVLFMANTGLRPDEANRLQFRDVEIVEDEGTNETILEIEVRGKRGVGYCKSMSGAVRPFERLQGRPRPRYAYVEVGPDADAGGLPEDGRISQPTDPVFPKSHRQLFNTILDEEGLKKDRDGQARTAYSLRHTYICLRLMEGADIYQVAKNCRTSVEMIEKYYASHIKNSLDASAINVRRKPRREAADATL